MGGAPTLPPVGLTCTGPQEEAQVAACQAQAATSTPNAHSSAPRSPRQDHHQDPHDANSRLQTGGITTIGPRHAGDTPPRASYGSNSPHRYITTKVARNFPRSFFETARKRCNSNVFNSMFEILAGELRATLLGNHSGISHRRGHRRGGALAGSEAWPQRRWAAAIPGQAGHSDTNVADAKGARNTSGTAQRRGAGPQARAPSATTQTLRSACVPCRSARAARRSRRSSRSPRPRRRAGPRR